MAKVRLTKSFTFEMAHALFNYNGKCKNIHGHSYRLEVTVIGHPHSVKDHASDGLLIDFGDLKKVVNLLVVGLFDHALVIQKKYSEKLNLALEENFERLIYVDYQPTCENLINDFANRIKGELPDRVELHRLVLHETATTYCEWYAQDQL